MNVSNITHYIIQSMSVAGAVVSPFALIALFRRTTLSKILGWVSIGCHVIAFIALIINWSKAPGFPEYRLLCLLLAPGAVAIVFNRAPRRTEPGHCTKCGYNLTGNVSGKCSECGEPVPAT